MIHALSVEHDLRLSTVFLNGNLKEEIFMKQPDGFVDGDYPNKVCRLHKALYGLKQARREWHKTLDEKLKVFGLIQSKYENCIYFRINNNLRTILGIYVDDIVIASNEDSFVENLKQCLSHSFEVRDLGCPSLCIGLEISKEQESHSSCQTSFIEKLISKYNLQYAKSFNTPMQPKLKLEREPSIDGENEPIECLKYQELIGSLMHLSVFNRPDIAHKIYKTRKTEV